MKINLGITKKLFIITTLVFGIFIAITLIIQSLFFERFYIDKKEGDLKRSIINFRNEYNDAEDAASTSQIIKDYEEENNLKIIILTSNMLKYNAGKSKEEGPRVRELTDFIRRWSEETENQIREMEEKEPLIYYSEDRARAERNMIIVAMNTESDEYIFALTSLQPVNEAVGVIKGLYLYFGIGAIVFTILLAFIYSRMIAKPLVSINKAATKMSRLDFREKCEVRSGDEIGNVAASLNFLSENLDNALTSLKDANAKLARDIEKERQLETMRREFVAAVSHELKTPISLIDGYAVGLKDDIFEDKDKDFYLDVIIDEAEKMGNLVSDMLDLSYLESGSFKLNPQEFNLTELIKLTLRKYETIIGDKDVTVKVTLINEIKVNGDWNRLEQVLTNFITNAIRHVNEGGTVYINSITKGETISIEIENTGSTVSEEDISKLWDKFYKIDKSRSRKLGGTGIGLSIVKNILERHGFSYGVANTDRGVKFYFQVPKL